ncbi:MAG: hypothetical protein R8K48_10315 [Gallionella sp.]
MPVGTRPARNFIPKQLNFPSISGDTMRVDFKRGTLFLDLGGVLSSYYLMKIENEKNSSFSILAKVLP